MHGTEAWHENFRILESMINCFRDDFLCPHFVLFIYFFVNVSIAI